jgi:uncharacterized membrane protein
MTGLPTFVGQHQYEQRPGDEVSGQTAEAMTFFETTDLAKVRQLIKKFGVRYIYIGQLERLLFSPEALRKFDVLTEAGELRVAYRNPGVTVYEVATNAAN